MTTHATDPIPITTIDNKPDNPWRGRITLGAATIAVGLATTMIISENSSDTRESKTPPELDGPNPYITSLIIEEGAPILHEPSDVEMAEGSSNLIATTDRPYYIDTIKGVDRIYTYHKGWVGMSQITASEYTQGVMDSDKIVWVDRDYVELTEDK